MKPSNDPTSGRCYRESARTALLGTIQRLRAQADQLEALVKVVPENEADWPPGAAEALWQMVVVARR